MILLALRSALSDRAKSGRIVLVGAWSITEPKTKAAVGALSALGMTEGRVLLVLERRSDEVVARSFRNLPGVHVLDVGELNAYDVLRSDWVVFTDATLPGSGATASEPEKSEGAGGADSVGTGDSGTARAGVDGEPGEDERSSEGGEAG